MRWVRRIGLALASLAAMAWLGGWLWVRSFVPSGPPPTTLGPGSLTWEAHGIPLIQAPTLRDAFRLQGYATARERLFQMELQRRAADGRLSELVGKAALPADRLHRIYGFRQVAEAAVARLPEAERRDLEAFAEGVNAFIREREGRWGLEFRLLSLRPDPWTPADSVKGLLLMNEDMSTTWRQELRAEMLQALPEAQRRFLAPVVTAQDLPLVPDAEPSPGGDTALLFAGASATPSVAGIHRSPWPSDLPPEAEGPAGSNAWVVAPGRSASGGALLANDPHLSLSAPGYWLPLRLQAEGRTWQGVAMVMGPGIVIGQGDTFAWGFTNLGTDVQDLFCEPAVAERVEVISLRGGATETLRVALGARGPQVRPGISLRWTALDPGNLRLSVRELMLARDWEGFNAALDHFPGPAMNAMYADRAGHIGWRATGLIPLRGPGQDGSRVVEGGPDRDWRGLLPQAQMPRVLDPAEGYLVTANQRVIGTRFPHPVATRWASPARARRIAELLRGKEKLEAADMGKIQMDVVSQEHRDLMVQAAPHLPKDIRDRFAGWDGAAAADSARFTEAERFRRALRSALLRRLLAGLSPDPEGWSWSHDDDALRAALGADQAAWTRAGLGDQGTWVREAWAEAGGTAPAWGEENRLDLQHPLGRAGGLLGWLFNPPRKAQPGWVRTVRVARPAFGQSLRLVVDWGRPEATTMVVPLGVSGHLGSPHRQDQLSSWLGGGR